MSYYISFLDPADNTCCFHLYNSSHGGFLETKYSMDRKTEAMRGSFTGTHSQLPIIFVRICASYKDKKLDEQVKKT